ncbi:alpha/beta fold hydrolase [Nocardiopsis potens]|uniref:alpha/beta fold hydrolase n=1 Tax=Nocardiopsis potens TaxID=1246458 RepID=UPI00034BDE7C|nr:alpha/beta hydrolase [Nocardiopsis potens]
MATGTTSAPGTGTLPVPGADLHYEVRGRGPLLVLVPGGAGDAGMYAGLLPHLADSYTVLTFDPRGFTRSPVRGPGGDQRPEVWADDVGLLIERFSPGEPARVVGNSSGAIVALHLLSRRPGLVRRVVAHEPPLLRLLPDPEPHRRLFAEVRDVFRADGADAAMARFSAGLDGGRGGHGGGRVPEEEEPPAAGLPPEIREAAARMRENTGVFLGRMLVPFSSSLPDLDVLAANAGRLALAAGRDSRSQVPLYGPARALADRLGCAFAEFPGGHLAAVEIPGDFARRLLPLLG